MEDRIESAVRNIGRCGIGDDSKLESVDLHFKKEGFFRNREEVVSLDYRIFSSILDGVIEENMKKEEIENQIYGTLNSIGYGKLTKVGISTDKNDYSFYANEFSQSISEYLKGVYINWREVLHKQRLLGKSRQRFLEPGVIKI